MIEKIINWLRGKSTYTSIGLFFLWGILMSILSGGIGTFWSIPVLLTTHTVNGLGIYYGLLKDSSGKRGALGIVLNLVGMIYNLSIDFLYLLL